MRTKPRRRRGPCLIKVGRQTITIASYVIAEREQQVAARHTTQRLLVG